MTKIDLTPEIAKSWSYAKALKIDGVFSGPTALNASADFKTMSTDPDASYEQLYLMGLQGSQYNFLLKDFSFFQYGISELDSVRFAYYPNPFLGATPDAVAELNGMQEYVSEGLISMDDFLHRVAEIRRPQHPPLVRYEYSKPQYKEASHPCSHLHLGFHGDNRWPVRRQLTGHAFSLLIFRLFYLEFWMQADTIRSQDRALSMDDVLNSARQDCRMLYEEEFSKSEERRFHFS